MLLLAPFGFATGQAQTTGSILRNPAAAMSRRDIPEADQARATMNDYGVCIVRMKAVAVRRALSRTSDTEADAALAKLAIPDCLQEGRLQMKGSLMRGAVYRALYIRDFGRTPPASPANAAVGDVGTGSENPLQSFGRCVLGVNPIDARRFILANPVTEAERTALAGLAAALSQCVAPGQQIRFSRATLQGVLAETAYRHAAPVNLVKN